MIRQHLNPLETDPDFRWRGGSVSRLEGLSDGVFAFAVALLAISQSVPRTYPQLLRTFQDMPAFALCFAFLLWCWYCHYKFFRRFGAEDMLTIVLNCAVLFLILFFVYPLRFLATFLITSPLFGPGWGRMYRDGEVVEIGQGYALMVLYAGIFIAIFALFAWLNFNAYRHREELELNRLERYVARHEVRTHLVSVGVGVVALAFAAFDRPALSGLSFFLMGPAHSLNGWLGWRGAERIKEGR